MVLVLPPLGFQDPARLLSPFLLLHGPALSSTIRKGFRPPLDIYDFFISEKAKSNKLPLLPPRCRPSRRSARTNHHANLP